MCPIDNARNSMFVSENHLAVVDHVGGQVSADHVGDPSWRRCDGGACVEVAAIGETVMMRSSASTDGRTLIVSRQEWQTFLDRAKDGLLDDI
jgi:hypothetical protein